MLKRGFLTWPLLMSCGILAHSQSAPEFEVASVKPSARAVGPDSNNRLTFSPAGLTARNATLLRLVAEAYQVQLRQVSGSSSLDQNEYDIEARAGHSAKRPELLQMLRTLLIQRFHLQEHSETREMRLLELEEDRTGIKIQPVKEGEAPSESRGLHFRGGMREFADFLSVQLTIPAVDNPNQPAMAGGPAIPVIDKTGLPGVYAFSVELRPELGTDMFTLWQRELPERFGLRLESRRGAVRVIVVDSFAKTPVAN